MSNKLYYRLCRRDLNGNLVSWMCPDFSKELTLDYHIDKTTWAPLGTIGIFVFPSIAEAEFYDQTCPSKIIISGEAIEPRKQLVMLNPLALNEWLHSKNWCEAFQELRYRSCAYGLYTCAGFIPKKIVSERKGSLYNAANNPL